MAEPSGIIWLTENYPPQKGGMAQSCDRIVSGLRKEGKIIHVIHFTNRKEAYKIEMEENGSYAAVPIHFDESHSLHLAYNFIVQRDLQSDLLIIFGGYLSMLAAPIFALWLKTKLLLMIRGNDFDTAIFSPKKRQVLKDAIERADLITSVSEQKMLQMKILFPKASIRYVANGIEQELWQPLDSDFKFAEDWRKKHSEEQLTLGCFGHLKVKKGLDVLLEALKSPALKKKFNLLLIGDISEDVRENLNASGASYEILPFAERLSLIKYFLSCHALIIPSHYDGMPNVLLEAGLLGIPVIGSRKDGMMDVITDKEDGFLFDPGNSQDLRRILFDFEAMTAKEREEMGARLKKKIADRYNAKIETDKYLELISTL